MPKLESVRTTAEAIGRISCIKTGEEIGLLYRWNNGETQAALFGDTSTGLDTSGNSNHSAPSLKRE
ncbi:MAG: hypothetical protein ACRBCL_12375 [Maritimibacter sp.]